MLTTAWAVSERRRGAKVRTCKTNSGDFSELHRAIEAQDRQLITRCDTSDVGQARKTSDFELAHMYQLLQNAACMVLPCDALSAQSRPAALLDADASKDASAHALMTFRIAREDGCGPPKRVNAWRGCGLANPAWTYAYGSGPPVCCDWTSSSSRLGLPTILLAHCVRLDATTTATADRPVVATAKQDAAIVQHHVFPRDQYPPSL